MLEDLSSKKSEKSVSVFRKGLENLSVLMTNFTSEELGKMS